MKFVRAEEAGVVLYSLLGQGLQAGTGAQAGGGLVESDMSVRPDAKHLEVNATSFRNFLFEGGAGVERVSRHPIRHMSIGKFDVGPLKQVIIHKGAITLGVVCRYTHIFIQIESSYLLKAQSMIAVPMDQLPVKPERTGPSGKPEHGVREGTYLRFHQIGRTFSHRIFVG